MCAAIVCEFQTRFLCVLVLLWFFCSNMSDSCYFKKYTAPDFNSIVAEKTSKCSLKIPKIPKVKPPDLKCSLDGLDTLMCCSERAEETPAAASISDSQYRRLHDIRYDTDSEFVAAMLKQWRRSVGRLTPWTPDERTSLMQRWYTGANNWTPAERSVFLSLKGFMGLGSNSNDFGKGVHSENDDETSMEPNTDDEDDEWEFGEQGGSKCGQKRRSNAGESSSIISRNSDGSYDSQSFAALLKMWAVRGNRGRPFPAAIADKLLGRWLAHESTWTPRERIIFHADQDPTIERAQEVCPDVKRRLLERLVPRNADGSEPLLSERRMAEHDAFNGNQTAGHDGTHDSGSPSQPQEEAGKATEPDTEPPASDYEKELKRFLASSAVDGNRRFRNALSAGIAKKYRIARIVKNDRKVELIELRNALFSQPPPNDAGYQRTAR